MKISCIGGGPAGLYLAILLKAREPGHQVTVFERHPVDVTQGWGVVFWDDLLRDLEASDPVTARAIAAQAFQWRGEVLDIEGRPPVQAAQSGYSIRRQRLLQILAERAQALGVELVHGQEVADPAALPPADVVVAADGSGSLLRRRQAGRFRTRIATGRNKYAWLGTTRIFDLFGFGFVPTPAGWIWFHAYAFEAGMSTFIVECAPETWAGLGFDGLAEGAALARLEGIFARHLQGHRLQSPGGGEAGGLPWLSFRRVTNGAWHSGNVVLAGDAAHTTHFSIGSGTRLAMGDAIALAARLQAGGDLQAAFAGYERDRKAAIRTTQRDARLSARWFETLPRHIGFEPPEVAALLLARRSRLLRWMPPRAYLRLSAALRRGDPDRRPEAA